MRKSLLLLGLLVVFISSSCGKKGPPAPRNQVLQEQTQEQSIKQDADKH